MRRDGNHSFRFYITAVGRCSSLPCCNTAFVVAPTAAMIWKRNPAAARVLRLPAFGGRLGWGLAVSPTSLTPKPAQAQSAREQALSRACPHPCLPPAGEGVVCFRRSRYQKQAKSATSPYKYCSNSYYFNSKPVTTVGCCNTSFSSRFMRRFTSRRDSPMKLSRLKGSWSAAASRAMRGGWGKPYRSAARVT